MYFSREGWLKDTVICIIAMAFYNKIAYFFTMYSKTTPE